MARRETPSFAAFLDEICTPDRLQRVLIKYGLSPELYRMKVCLDMVRGHRRHLKRMLLEGEDRFIVEKCENELHSALTFAMEMNYDLDEPIDG